MSRFFRANFPKRSAFLATLLFAVSGAHGMVYAWISCRHLLIAGVFGVAAISLCQQALASRRAALDLGVGALLVIALAAGEAALGVVPFLVFCVLAHRDAEGQPLPWSERARHLLAPAVITLLYLLA